MASAKPKYSVTKAPNRLPPIREESSVRTPRSPALERIQDPPYRVKAQFNPPAALNKPRIHVRPLPGNPWPQPNINYAGDPNIPEPKIKPPALFSKPKTPEEVKQPNSTVVDGIVADYLHYAKYGHIIPVYEGIGNLTCSCCTDRNRENVRTLLGLPATEQEIRKKYKPSVFLNKGSQAQEEEFKVDDTSWNKPKVSEEATPWMTHQPLPAVTNYLNPEFNRPIYAYQKPPDIEIPSLVFDSVLHANTKYDEAMKRLTKYGSRLERQDDGSYFIND